MVTNVEQNGHAKTAQVEVEESVQNKLQMQIKNALKDLPVQQVKRLAQLIEKRSQLKQFFSTFPGQANRFESHIEHIDKCLDYERPFKVAIVAVTGTGKSTLLNSMLARDLVLVKNVGGAATGCALYLQQDAPVDTAECAVVTYRDEQSIRRLIEKYFVQKYNLEASVLAEPLSENLALSLTQLTPNQPLPQEEQREFDEMKNTLVDLVQQYVRHDPAQLQKTFRLDSETDTKRLLALTDEGSSTNETTHRIIGLVEAVNYHICANEPSTANNLPLGASALSLPDNVCLVDLPGLDGTCLHNIIIHEGIKDADAVLFVVHPRRFQTLSNSDLLSRISRFVSSKHDPHSSERIFLVINAKDEITEEIQQALPTIRKNADQFLEEISPGSSQYAQQFIISAWAALQAQKAMKGKPIGAPSKYAGVQRSLGITNGDHQAVLKESDVPKLIESLNEFVKDCTARQIKTASRDLDYVIESLIHDFEQQKEQITQGEGDRYRQRQINELLAERKASAKSSVESFRYIQIEGLPTLSSQLSRVVDIVCDEIDNDLQAEMPRYWKKHFNPVTYRPSAELYGGGKNQPFLGDIEIELWDSLSVKMQILAQEVIRNYQLALQSYELSSRVVQYGSGKIAADALEQELKNGIEAMSVHLMQAIRGFAIGPLVDPSRHFIRFSEERENQENTLSNVVETTIPQYERELAVSDFYELVKAIREHYAVSIHQDCITNLINLYQYEMIRIENRVLSFILDQFDQLSHDPHLTIEALTDVGDRESKWFKLEEINHQLTMLQQIVSCSESLI